MASNPTSLLEQFLELGMSYPDALRHAQAAANIIPRTQTSQPRPQNTDLNFRNQPSNTIQERPDYDELDKGIKLTKAFRDIPYFSGMTDSVKFEAWLPIFEKILKTHRISDDQTKIDALYSKLNPPASDYLEDFLANNPVRRKSYANVIEFLITCFPENRQQYRKELHSCSRKEGETLEIFAWRVSKLIDRVLPSTADNPRIREEVRINSFLNGLSSHLQSKLEIRLKHKPVLTLSELVIIAERYDLTTFDVQAIKEEMANFKDKLDSIEKKAERQPSVKLNECYNNNVTKTYHNGVFLRNGNLAFYRNELRNCTLRSGESL